MKKYKLALEPVALGHHYTDHRVIVTNHRGEKMAELMEYLTETHPGWERGFYHWPWTAFRRGTTPPFSINAREFLARLND